MARQTGGISAADKPDPPGFDAIVDALAQASIGNLDSRVPVPPDADPNEPFTKLGHAINILLGDLEFRHQQLQSALDQVRSANATLERRVQERTHELGRTNEDLRAFNGMVAHDLRAPLRAVEHLTRMAVEDFGQRMGSQATDIVEKAHDASLRMSALVEDLLNLARASQADVVRQKVDVGAVARDAYEELRVTEPTRQVEFVVADDMHAEADFRLLRVVLVNLLSNALKFTRRAPAARIEVGMQRLDTGEQAFFVRDNGAGFDPRHAEHMFTPFKRLHSGLEFEGTGVGLATVRRIVERHGGRTWSEGRPGAGATLWFTLPASGLSAREG